MPAETIDTLELSIKTRAGTAKRAIDNLATSIDGFGDKVQKYVADMVQFGDALQKIADAASKLSGTKNLGRVFQSANSDARGKTKIKDVAEAARIAKEEDSAWKQYERWNRESNQEYRQSHRLNWKEVVRNADLYAGKNAPTDNTRQEIAEWKAIEDARDKAQQMTIAYGQAKQYTEELVQSMSIGKTDIKQIVEEVTGISRGVKSAAASMGDFLLAEEKAAEKGKTLREEFDAIKANAFQNDSVEKDKNANIISGLGAPSIAAERSRAISLGRLDEWMAFRNVPKIVETATSRGIISPEDAQAALDAFYGIGEAAEEAKEAEENMQGFSDAVKDAKENVEDTKKEMHSLKDVLKAAGSIAGNSFIGKLSGQLFRIAKMRGLRYIVRELASGFREGADNMYQWSKGIGGHFAGAMDNIASKAMLAKNSIATAFAPAIEALVPVLSTVVSWINAASNAFAQLIALFTGQTTWTKAVETAETWGDATKKASGGARAAAKDMKDLLADWDELNVIQSESGSAGGGGGGAGNTAADYANMFKEMTAFDEWTRYFEQIKTIAIAIGAAIAGWKLIDMASTFLEKIGVAETTVKNIASKLGKALSGMVLLTISFELADITGQSIARNGVNLTNALTGLGSVVSGALGGYFLASAINPSLGVIGAVAGLTMSLAVGIKAYVDEKRVMLYEEVDKYLEAAVMSKVFTFDVESVVERVNTTIENAEAARRDVQDQLASVLSTVDVLKLGVDEKNTWNELYKKVVGDGETSLIGKIQKELEADKNFITVYYQTKSKEGLEGKAANGSAVANGMRTELLANDWLSKKYEELGREFASKFNEGEIAEIKEGAAPAAMAILETITGAKAAAEKALNEAELEIDLINAKKGLDDEVVMDEMATLFEEYEQKLADSRKKAAEEHYTLLKKELAELTFLGADEDLIKDIENQLEQAKDELEKTDFKIVVHGEFVEDEKKMFGEELVKRYGPELAQLVSALSGEYLGDLDFLNEVMNKGGYDSFVKTLMADFMSNLPESATKWLLDNNIDISDFFTNEQKQKIQEGRNRIEPDEFEEVYESGFDGASERINAEIDSILDVLRESAEKSGMSIEDYIAGMDASEIWPLLENIREVLDKSNLNGAEQAALDETGSLTSDLIDENLDDIYQLLKDQYAEETKKTDWYDPNQGMTVDAVTSGMALDSTMENAANALSGKSDETNGLIDKIFGRVGDLITATDRAGNRPINVVISPSSLFGRTMGMSDQLWSKIIG